MAIADEPMDSNDRTDAKCELLEFLEGLGGRYERCRAKFYALLKKFCSHPDGPKMLGADLCHVVHFWADRHGKEIKLWQITAGDIRVLFIYDRDRVIVCTHGFVKKKAKFQKSEGRHAEDIWNKYQNSR